MTAEFTLTVFEIYTVRGKKIKTDFFKTFNVTE